MSNPSRSQPTRSQRRSWRDGPVRALLKSVALIRYRIDVWFYRAGQYLRYGRPRYDLAGDCEPCGACCESPTIVVPRIIARSPLWFGVFTWWQRVVNRFDLRELEGQVAVFSCRHYDPETRLCDSYWTRPGICRDYPASLRHATSPDLFNSCTFVVIDRLQVRLDGALDTSGLPPEKIAEIKARLAGSMTD